jgi:hypothetical protein
MPLRRHLEILKKKDLFPPPRHGTGHLPRAHRFGRIKKPGRGGPGLIF